MKGQEGLGCSHTGDAELGVADAGGRACTPLVRGCTRTVVPLLYKSNLSVQRTHNIIMTLMSFSTDRTDLELAIDDMCTQQTI